MMSDYLNFDLTLPDYSLAPADQRLVREGQSLSDIAKGVSYTEYDSSFGKLDFADPFRLGYNMSASYWSGGSSDEFGPSDSQDWPPTWPPTEYNTTPSKNPSVWPMLGLGIVAFFVVRAL
jgi:hypothetical protein